MIAKLSEFKPWLLIVGGLAAALASLLGLGLLVQGAQDTWPEARHGILIGHVILGSVISYTIVGVAFEAIALRQRIIWFDDATVRTIAEYLAEIEEEDDEVEDRTAYIENPDLKKEEYRHG